MNILIVDDQPTNLKLLRAQLEAEGHVVAEAVNGIEGLAVLGRQGTDAVISDILMPQMDGYRFCSEVRKDPRFSRIPFIFYTATYTSSSDEKLCFDLGGDKYLRKPSSAAEIAAALREAVELGGRREPSRVAELAGPDVMTQYSRRLVSKLEQKHSELEAALRTLQGAHEEILELNRHLEERMGERTTELVAANKELEAFSYSISHDLRVPLRSIDGFVDLLRRDYGAQLPAEADRKLGQIREYAAHMSQLIEGLLAFSRFSRQPLTKARVSPAAIVKRVLEQLQPEMEARRVAVSIAELPDCRADEMLLQQVFANLLSNAVKYSRQRDPAIIDIGWQDDHGRCAYFVRDNGAGFDMQYAQRLFGVFERLHGRKEFEGVGVGLSIVQRIVERHGGRIWAEAVVDNGATFYFTLAG
jgi:signal transduction histidine kinase